MIALITGASSGIGQATAELFLQRGWHVVGFDIAEANIQNDEYEHYIVDVRNKSAFPRHIKPHVIVNNAGVQNGEDIAVNLQGAINIAEAYAFNGDFPASKPTNEIRSVINVGSAAGHTGSEFPEYAASKGGILAYTKNLANRLAPQAICNSIDPGGVTTELNGPVMEDEALWSRIMELTPLKRWATPEEIAEWIYFVGVTNRFMTGQNLLIDGGEAGAAEFVWPEK